MVARTDFSTDYDIYDLDVQKSWLFFRENWLRSLSGTPSLESLTRRTGRGNLPRAVGTRESDGMGERLRSLGSPRTQGRGTRTGVRSCRGKNRRRHGCNTTTHWERGAPGYR